MLLGGGSPRSGQQRQQPRPKEANNENCKIDMNMEDPSRNLEVPSSSTVAQSSTSKASISVTNSEASSNSAGEATSSQEYAEEEWKSHFSHDFVAKWFNRPTWCKYCGRYIWQPIGRSGFACSRPGCNYTVHKRCIEYCSSFVCFIEASRSQLHTAKGLDIFQNQVAGHKGRACMLKDGPKILKPFNENEFQFYEGLRNCKQDPQPFFPHYYGVRSIISDSNNQPNHYIVLEDLTAGLTGACICDLKIGSRGHDDKASSRKVLQQKALCQFTTSSTLGFRMCGMKVWQKTGPDIVRNKIWGSKLKDHTMRGAIVQFLDNGEGVRFDVIPHWLPKLYSIKKWFEQQTEHHFYSSSILLIYDGAAPEGDSAHCDVRMVDFAHAAPSLNKDLDTNYLGGLCNVILLLEEMLKNEVNDEEPVASPWRYESTSSPLNWNRTLDRILPFRFSRTAPKQACSSGSSIANLSAPAPLPVSPLPTQNGTLGTKDEPTTKAEEGQQKSLSFEREREERSDTFLKRQETLALFMRNRENDLQAFFESQKRKHTLHISRPGTSVLPKCRSDEGPSMIKEDEGGISKTKKDQVQREELKALDRVGDKEKEKKGEERAQ